MPLRTRLVRGGRDLGVGAEPCVGAVAQRCKGLDAAVLGRRVVAEDQDAARGRVQQHVEPAVARDHGAGAQQPRHGDVAAGHRRRSRRCERQRADHVDQRVHGHQLGDVAGAIGHGFATVEALPYPPSEYQVHQCVDDGDTQLRHEYPQVVQVQAHVRIGLVDPAPSSRAYEYVRVEANRSDGAGVDKNPEDGNKCIEETLRQAYVEEDRAHCVDGNCKAPYT